MTPARLAAIRTRYEAATPGEWQPGQPHPDFCDCLLYPACSNVWTGEGQDITRPCAGLSAADAAFIAAAHQDIPDLLAEVERLRAEVARRIAP